MAEIWTTDYVELLKDRFLKLTNLTFVAPQKELLEKLDELKQEYLESLGRVQDALSRAKKTKYALIFAAIVIPISGIYLVIGERISGLSLLIVLAFSIGFPWWVYHYYLPKFLEIKEFCKRYEGAEERINIAIQLVQHYEGSLSSKAVELNLALQGIDIDSSTFRNKMGTSDNEAEFTGTWLFCKMDFADHFAYELGLEKKILVQQSQVASKDGETFWLERKFSLWERVKLEVILEEEFYEGFRQFRDRDWKEGEHALVIENISAGTFNLGIEASLQLLNHIKGNKLFIILGEANGVHLPLKEALDLLDFVKTHFLKK